MSGHMKEDTFKCKECNALYSIVWEEEVSIKFCPVCGKPTPSDKVPGPPCGGCGKPTSGNWDGATVYHAECLKKLFPYSVIHLNDGQVAIDTETVGFTMHEPVISRGVFVGPPLQCKRCGCLSFRLENDKNLCNHCHLEAPYVA